MHSPFFFVTLLISEKDNRRCHSTRPLRQLAQARLLRFARLSVRDDRCGVGAKPEALLICWLGSCYFCIF